MFDRKKYKRFALMQIKGRWTPAILATLLSLIILQPLTYIIVFGIQNEQNVFLPVITYIFSKWVLDIGFAHFFITMSRSPSPIKVNDFVEGLSEWKKGCTVGFWKDLWITLWSMLFIIPGLVKHYAYSQSIFLAAEFPNLTAKKAVHISKIITNNHLVFSECTNPDVSLYCTGGHFDSQSHIFLGSDAEKYIENINADIVFFSSQAISNDGEISDVSEKETSLRRKMLTRANKKIFLCDSSKLGLKKTFTLCTKDDIDVIICDKKLPWE